ncbi:MAG: aminotransferase class III-fold pyridoxal phosphate-dependent enzyme [Thermomicrobiales bacterium]|nr:aminotransferase class III-fold pyridoxal phosphate-dependent enzyme [Thermomicrobiales bacterium]
MAQAPATTIAQEFAARFAGSLALHQRARQAIAGGINHDGRNIKPFPPYIARADGARKWDVDDNELLDYVIGHGALLLGHNDPDILAAMQAQLPHGLHYGACHELEVRWAEQVQKMVPSAERVKMTGSGTESTLLAMRIARSYTDKPIILKFEGHFHGWNDYAIKGEKTPFDAPTSPGVLKDVMDTVAVIPANDPAALEARLAQGDVAALILEPSGGAWATLPFADGFLAQTRELASRYGAVLIFDEVITGFRWAPGGAQERFGITPDLTTFAKIVAGGMPGGAVAGKAAVMEMLEFKDEPGWNATRKVRHQGTYNAQPLAAAAGATCLEKIADGSAQRVCDDLATQLRTGFNTVLEQRGLPGFAWGESSVFHVALGQSCNNRSAGDLRKPEGVATAELKNSAGTKATAMLYPAMMLEGIELFHGGGMLSTAHTDADIERTLAAFDRSLQRIEAEGGFGA